MEDNDAAAGWAAIIDRIVRGDKFLRPVVRVGRTPPLLVEYGLPPASVIMTVAKIARCRREHPEVDLGTWRRLPQLLSDPLAIFPSVRRDGSLIVVLVVRDLADKPILVPIAPGTNGGSNVVLSVYGKNSGMSWIETEIARARSKRLSVYEAADFAASLPQPKTVETTSSSHGPFPSDGTTKPNRPILSILRKVNPTLMDD